MAAVDDDDYGRFGPVPAPGRVQWIVNVAGGLTSIALVLGLALWGYRLAVRDVTGIPVIRALAGPMRIAPPEPGGEIAAHTGLSVNDVAAEGFATPLPDQMVLAPRPVDLSAEDQPVAARGAVTAGVPTRVALVGGTGTAVAPDADADAYSALPDSGQSGPAQALVPSVSDVAATDLPPPAAPDTAAPQAAALETAVESALAEALGTADVAPAPPGAVLRSPRPERRPEGDGSAEDLGTTAEVAPAGQAGLAGEVDVATLTVGTQLVQLGAFDDEAGARAEWGRLKAKFGDLIAPKALVLQTAQSAGRRFVRLRALGFEDEADARRFCSALLAENASCIPVAHRT